MRGRTERQVMMLSTVTPEQLVPADHPIRRIKVIVECALCELSPTFDAMYARGGRASIPPERLLKGCLLIALYSVRSERQFCERLQYDLLFKWFLDMDIEEPAFDATSFTKNRDRLLAHEVAARFFTAVLGQAKAAQLISAEHFTVDGTLLEAWASLKSFQPKDSANNHPRGGSTGGATPRSTFAAGHARTTATSRPPTPTPGSSPRASTRPPSSATAATCSWRTATAWWWTCWWHRPRDGRSGRRVWPCSTGTVSAVVHVGGRWLPTRPMTPRTSSRGAGACG